MLISFIILIVLFATLKLHGRAGKVVKVHCGTVLGDVGRRLCAHLSEFVHDGYRLDHGSFGSCTKEKWTKSGNFQFDINFPFQNTVYPKPKGAFPKTQA